MKGGETADEDCSNCSRDDNRGNVSPCRYYLALQRRRMRGRSVGPSNPLGTYNNPIEDEPGGDLSVPVHRGMYCVAGASHHGWLRPWERSPVIEASCGSAADQMPY